MLYLSVTFSTPLFILMIVFTGLVAFILGVIWRSSAKDKKVAEEEAKVEAEKKYASVIDIEEAILRDNTYSWRKRVEN